MFFCEWRRAYPRMQGAIHGKTAQKNNADCLEYFQLSTSRACISTIAEKVWDICVKNMKYMRKNLRVMLNYAAKYSLCAETIGGYHEESDKFCFQF